VNVPQFIRRLSSIVSKGSHVKSCVARSEWVPGLAKQVGDY
jgi:hypothetical protein